MTWCAAAWLILAVSCSAARKSVQEDVAAPAQLPPPSATAFSPFKPGIAVIIAILTMSFCITFLLLLYTKHCNAAGDGVVSYEPTVCPWKNSGVDRSLVESLPVFRFASLRGLKEGLECAVCLNRFEPIEVLRLLPKCKHAFHVECVDTWLDAHSTCPLCRYRVDPEDLLLVESAAPAQPSPDTTRKSSGDSTRKSFAESIRRVSGRHSSAGERGLLPGETSSYRRSHDDRVRAKKETAGVVAVGCFDRQYRKDGLLITSSAQVDRKMEHRIIISDDVGPASTHERWSDVLPSDLLYLRSEMVMNEGPKWIKGRSVSDVSGLSRSAAAGGVGCGGGGERVESRRSDLLSQRDSREAGALARWTAWISQHSDVRAMAPTV